MTAATSPQTIPCTGPAVRAWLLKSLPEQVEGFDRDFADGLAEAGQTYDLARVAAVVRRWWGLARARVHVTQEEMALVERIERGDFPGLSVMQPDGKAHPA